MFILRLLMVMALSIGLWDAAKAAQLVVIASTAPAFKLGAIIDGAKSITLPPGSDVTLVSADGKTIKFKGPYEGRPNPSPEGTAGDLLGSLSEMVTATSKDSASVAVFRSASMPTRPDVWSVNIGRSGVYCLRSDEPVMLWRPRAKAKTVLWLTQIGGRQGKIRKEWPRGEQTIVWPAELPLSDGASYVARLKGMAEEEVRVLLIPEDLPSDAHRAAWMAGHGCDPQALRVVENLGRSAQ